MTDKLPLESNGLAEALRQSHCDRKTQSHKCLGVITVGPGTMVLDCKLCGDDQHVLENTVALVREAKEICQIVGTDYDKLAWDKRRELLLAVLDLAFNGL